MKFKEQPQFIQEQKNEEEENAFKEAEKEIHMKRRAMRINETPEEYKAEREQSWAERQQKAEKLEDTEIEQQIERSLDNVSDLGVVKVYDSSGKFIFSGNPDQLMIFWKNKDYNAIEDIGAICDEKEKSIFRFGPGDDHGFTDRKRIEGLFQQLKSKVARKKIEAEDAQKLSEIRTQLAQLGTEQETPVAQPEQSRQQNHERVIKPKTPEEIDFELSIEDRKKLSGWVAGYELAKIAKKRGINLSTISREEYAQFAIDNSLAIDDDQLRGATWQRMITSLDEVMAERKRRRSEVKGSEVDKVFDKFAYSVKKKAGEENRYIRDNIKVRSGTYDSNGWLFFGINKSIEHKPKETHKSYISLKDIKTLSPDKFVSFMEALRDSQYNGDIKIFQDLAEQGIMSNDQIVMHGRSEKDAKLALQIAEKFFANDINQKSMGKDESIDGKMKSYSQILADKIKKAVKSKES